MKEQMKAWANKIRQLKSIRKLKFRGTRDLYEIEYEIKKLKREFRHHHIAICELRGKTRDQIEKPRENNKPSQRYIDRIKELLGENVRIGTA
jgi:hypothetical protein